MDRKIGTCGNCGDAVTVPREWMSTKAPMPRCVGCGAAPELPHGPAIKMDRPGHNGPRSGPQ